MILKPECGGPQPKIQPPNSGKSAGKSAGKMQERLPTSTLRRGKVPRGRPARAPTSTAERGTKKNGCTKGVGAEGAPPLCGRRWPPLIFLCSALGCRGRSPCWTSPGHFAAPQCRGRRPFLHFPALFHTFSASPSNPCFAFLPAFFCIILEAKSVGKQAHRARQKLSMPESDTGKRGDSENEH